MKALLLTLSCLLLFAAGCGGEDSDSNGGGSAGSSAGAALGPDTGAPDTGIVQSSAFTLPDKLIVTTNVDLEVTALRQAFVAISGYARDFGGFVADAQINDDEEDGSAFLRLRVPASRHDDMVASVRNFAGAEVKREESTAREVTAEYTDLQSRVTNLQATEAQYQQLLNRAGTIDDVLKVTAKLDGVRGDIEQIEGRIKLIEDQSDFATVAVRMSLPPPVLAEATSGGLPSPVTVLIDAFATSFTVAHAVLNLVIVLIVAGLWIIPASLIAVFSWRRLRRPVEAVKAWFG
ncbi:MAG TPA: DUF4349 domain-containing protein [Dehalococcoidia bacterium]|nr:DUF4349 domain-containing protein [Dehalococcoidia bacterium]